MKPILFNTEMVRAILEGRKTVTRRVVKPQPPAMCHIARERYSWAWVWWTDGDMHRFAPPYNPATSSMCGRRGPDFVEVTYTERTKSRR